MVVVRRIWLLVMGFLALAAVLLLGVMGYHHVLTGPEEPKLTAENLLYMAIVSAVLIALVLGWILARSWSISMRLSRITEVVRYGNPSVEPALRRLGPLGEQMAELYHLLGEVGEQRAVKISALSRLNALLLSNLDLPLLVVDRTGTVTGWSRTARNRLPKEAPDPRGRHISEVLGEVNFTDLTARLEHDRKLYRAEDVQYFPVFNRNGELGDVVVILAKNEVHQPEEVSEPQTGTRASQDRFFQRLFRRRP